MKTCGNFVFQSAQSTSDHKCKAYSLGAAQVRHD